MNATLKVIQVNPTVTGQSAKGEWSKTEVITEETTGQFPKKIALTIWGTKLPIPVVGQTYDFSFDIESREYNGRWFTECKTWHYSQDQATEQPTQQAQPVAGSVEADGGLPF